MHDGFFDRVITSALDRGVTQFVLVGGDDTGRELRQARPGTRWWQVGEPGERLERDAGQAQLRARLAALFCAEGAVSRLDEAALTTLLAEVRGRATPGSRPGDRAPTLGARGRRDRRPVIPRPVARRRDLRAGAAGRPRDASPCLGPGRPAQTPGAPSSSRRALAGASPTAAARLGLSGKNGTPADAHQLWKRSTPAA